MNTALSTTGVGVCVYTHVGSIPTQGARYMSHL